MGYSRSRAKCVPLQYPSTATRGVKEALGISKPFLNDNLIVVSTPLQEKINTSENTLNLNRESADQVSQPESGMFYELLSRKRMECEKYQDCSWFQQDLEKSVCMNKLSPAEIFDPFIDANEFNMSAQCAGAHLSPWGDEYLELFTDDILKENYKLREKKDHMNITHKNFYDNFEGDNFDSYNINFNLKKSDSLDSMKNISLTNPSEVIPITYKERLNNPNYGQIKLQKMKSEIKEEIQSPVTDVHIIDTDDSELNIGREEEVEEMDAAEDVQVANKKKTVNLDQVKSEISFEVQSDYAVNQKNCQIKEDSEESNYKKLSVPFKPECGIDKQTTSEKFDLNLDIAKLNFEQPLNMSTPDLDFMDLVDFINEEMRQEGTTPASNSTPNNTNCKKNTNQDLSEQYSSVETVQSSNLVSPQASPIQDQPILKKMELNTSEMLSSSDIKNNNTVNFDAKSDSGVSIAERIKTSAKRRTRKSLKDLIDSEDDEDFGSSDEDYKDDDYDYKEDLLKRRSMPMRRQTKSCSMDSGVDGKREEVDSYRERRDKNNEASRRSRQNRKARERHMYETLEEEERRNVRLKAEADILEKQVTSLRQLLLQVVLHKGGGTT